MRKVLVVALASIVLATGIIGMLSCASQVQKYENAKLEAEQKMTELEAEFNQPPEDINIANIGKLSSEIRQAMYKVAMLKPIGYDDDYKQWSQQMRQRLESIY